MSVSESGKQHVINLQQKILLHLKRIEHKDFEGQILCLGYDHVPAGAIISFISDAGLERQSVYKSIKKLDFILVLNARVQAVSEDGKNVESIKVSGVNDRFYIGKPVVLRS